MPGNTKRTNYEVRSKVNEALSKLGVSKPQCVSNPQAARHLGLIPAGLRNPAINSRKLLREWAFPSEDLRLEVWRAQLERQLARDKALGKSSAPKVYKPSKSTPKQAVYQPELRPDRVVSASFLDSYEWRRIRMEALKKFGPRCQCCGATPETGAVMNVDHIKPRRLFPELALTLDNLQILCNECNHGKGNWDMTDWRAGSMERS